MRVNTSYLEDNKKELIICYDYIKSPFEEVLLMYCNNKVCYLGFLDTKISDKNKILEIAKKSFKNLKIIFKEGDLSFMENKIFTEQNVDILLIGSSFQIKVWEALIKVKCGSTISYEELSKKLENVNINKNYTRASSRAVASNKISFIIPCHRIIRKNGSINKYLWGVDVKKRILKHEGVNF